MSWTSAHCTLYIETFFKLVNNCYTDNVSYAFHVTSELCRSGRKSILLWVDIFRVTGSGFQRKKSHLEDIVAFDLPGDGKL